MQLLNKDNAFAWILLIRIGHWFGIIPKHPSSIFQVTSADLLRDTVFVSIDYLSTCFGAGIIKHSRGLARSDAGMAKQREKTGGEKARRARRRSCQTSDTRSAPRRCELELNALNGGKKTSTLRETRFGRGTCTQMHGNTLTRAPLKLQLFAGKVEMLMRRSNQKQRQAAVPS